MIVDYYIDPDTGEPHIYKHSVTEWEAEDVLSALGTNDVVTQHVGGGKRATFGTTAGGRTLLIMFTYKTNPDRIHVISARDLQGKARRAYNRRKRKK